MATGESLITDERGIPAEERAEILAEIESLVAEKKIRVDESAFIAAPRKRGFVLPVIVNLSALVIIGLVVTILSLNFDARQEDLALESAAFFSTEARLIEEILADSERRLEEKEAEISDIRDRLAGVDAERQALEASLEDRVEARAAELRAGLEEELAAERARLAAAGATDVDIQARLAELEAAQQAELEQSLAGYRSEVESELAAQEAELARLAAELEANLQDRNQEREEILAEAAAREAELEAQLAEERRAGEAEREALAEQVSEAQARFETLLAGQQRVALITDQIIGGYRSVIDTIVAGDFGAAAAAVGSLRALLSRPNVASIPEIARRLETELELLDLIEAQLSREEELRARVAELEAPNPDTFAVSSFRNRIDSVLVDAEASLAAGNRTEALQTYLSGVRELVPAAAEPLEALSTRIDEIHREQLAALEAANLDLETRLAAEAEARTVEIERFETQLRARQDAIASLEAELAGREAQLQDLEARLSSRLDELGGMRDQLAARGADVRALEEQLAETREAAEARLAEARSRTEEVSAELERLRGEVASGEAGAARDAGPDVDVSGGPEAETGVAEAGAAEAGAAQTLGVAEPAQGQAAEALRAGIEGLKAELAKLRFDLEQSRRRSAALSRAVEERDRGIDELEARLSERLAEENRLTEALSGAEDLLAEQEALLASYEAEIERQRGEVAAGRVRIEELESTIAEGRGLLESAQREASEARAERDRTAAELARREEAQAQATAALRSRAEELEMELGRTEETLRAVRSEREVLAALVASYEDTILRARAAYQERLAAMRVAVSNGDYQGAWEAIISFLRLPEVELIAPGIDEAVAESSEGLLEAAREESRRAAFQEILSLTTYLSGLGDREEERAALEEQLEAEPLFATVARELQTAYRLGGFEREITLAQLRFLGTVAVDSPDGLVVEPLVSLRVGTNDKIEIRRPRTTGGDEIVAYATITSVAEGKIEARVDQLVGETLPAAGDVVYLEDLTASR